MTPRARWRAAFAHFGIDPSEPNALEKLTTCLALQLAKANAGGESALPMFDVAFPSRGRWDGGKHSTLKNWRIDRAIEKQIYGDWGPVGYFGPTPRPTPRMSQRAACEAVFRTMNTGARNARSLEKAFIGRQRELGMTWNRGLPGIFTEASERAQIFADLWRALAVVTQHPDAPDDAASKVGKIKIR